VIGTTDPVATHAIRVVSVMEYGSTMEAIAKGPLYRHTSSSRAALINLAKLPAQDAGGRGRTESILPRAWLAASRFRAQIIAP
jgi:hypothetical protein